ncbi:GGDEF domain-containing protein [Paenibacillus hodogayensis]|uniref:GGDEF domain-containing protein n=1 Tax=Paenibacillus hodogayensis TaxID=279208 RepID=A0ABV5VWK6_9BACL
MKYRGRFISLLVVVTSSLGLLLYNYVFHGFLDMIYVIATVCFLAIGWGMGKQYDEVKYLSEKDLLTESYNRRFLATIFPKLKQLSDKKSRKLIILLIDVDNFKSINDQYNHSMGDFVLQRISIVLKNLFRVTDYIVRWGGDEFLILVPNPDESWINQPQDRLRLEYKSLSKMISMDVTVSIGYAIYPDEGTELKDLIEIADRKMYRDKYDKNYAQHL